MTNTKYKYNVVNRDYSTYTTYKTLLCKQHFFYIQKNKMGVPCINAKYTDDKTLKICAAYIIYVW